MKKFLLFVVLLAMTLSGCCDNRASIKKSYIDNLNYNEDTKFITFDVVVDPNSFEIAQIFFVNQEDYKKDSFSSSIYELKDKITQGSFSIDYSKYDEGLYYLFLDIQAKDQKKYRSDISIIDLRVQDPIATFERSEDDNSIIFTIKTDEIDIKQVEYCLVDDQSATTCDNQLSLYGKYINHNYKISIAKTATNLDKYLLVLVKDFIGNELVNTYDLSA